MSPTVLKTALCYERLTLALSKTEQTRCFTLIKGIKGGEHDGKYFYQPEVLYHVFNSTLRVKISAKSKFGGINLPYTIKEISELTGLPASTLRYYDKQGLLPNLKRDSNNVRMFSNEDCRHIRLITCLKRAGLSERLKIFHRRREILRGELESLQEVLGVIEYKCWYYETACKAGTEEVMRNLKPSDIPEKFRKARESLHVV